MLLGPRDKKEHTRFDRFRGFILCKILWRREFGKGGGVDGEEIEIQMFRNKKGGKENSANYINKF